MIKDWASQLFRFALAVTSSIYTANKNELHRGILWPVWNLFVWQLSLFRFREKYFMIGEASEKRDIDEDTALEPDPRLEWFFPTNFFIESAWCWSRSESETEYI